MLAMLMLLALCAPVEAQTPPAGQQPAAQPGAAPGQQTPSGETKERNTTFDYFIAFFGVALVMVVVCYPSRRY